MYRWVQKPRTPKNSPIKLALREVARSVRRTVELLKNDVVNKEYTHHMFKQDPIHSTTAQW